MNSYCRYVDEDDKANTKLEIYDSEEIMEREGNEIGEYFEEDQKTNVKIEEQGYSEETIENEEKIPDKSNTNKSCNICMKSYKKKRKVTDKGSLKGHINPWNAASFWTLKNHVFHIWQKTLTGSRERKNIVLGDESPMTLSEMP